MANLENDFVPQFFQLHVHGCENFVPGQAPTQRCLNPECRRLIEQRMRQLLTNAYLLLNSSERGPVEIWNKYYQALMAELQFPDPSLSPLM